MKIFLQLLGVLLLTGLTNAQCTLNNNSSVSSGFISSTSNSQIDNLIQTEKLKLEQFFSIKVDIKIYSGNNGLARKTSQNTNYNGTIELGKDLLTFEFNKIGPITKESIGKYMIMSIMAHEFAHIYQYTHPEYVFANNVIQEIHADMLAGYYISRYFIDNANSDPKYNFELSKKISNIITDISISFGWMGDTQYWSQQHHGNYFTRAFAYQEPWRCLSGSPTRFSCENLSDFLSTSLENAEYMVDTFDED